MSKQNDPQILRCIETTRKVWFDGKGFILVRPLPDDIDCIEICTEPGKQSSDYFGNFSIATGQSRESRALAFALIAAADEMDGIQSTETK